MLVNLWYFLDLLLCLVYLVLELYFCSLVIAYLKVQEIVRFQRGKAYHILMLNYSMPVLAL